MAKKTTYEIIKRDNQFYILKNGKEEIVTPLGTIFHIPYEGIALQMAKDIELLGYESYTSALSSLCHAFTFDNIQNNNSVEEIREELISLNYEEDYWFNPSSEGLPPARILWDHVFYADNRGSQVREWLKNLSSLQLSTALTVFHCTTNMNLAYLYGKIIEEGKDGLLIDIKNIYNNLLSSSLDGDYIDRLFQIFKVFYTAEKG